MHPFNVSAVATATLLCLATACATAAGPAARTSTPSVAAVVMTDKSRPGDSCRPMSAALANGAGRETPTEGRPQRAAGESQQLALGQTHCWWACYPGSGCDYICSYFPQ